MPVTVFAIVPGPTELWVVLALLLIFFGAKKLPELARSMGSSVTQFKKGLRDDGPSQLESGEKEKKDKESEGKDPDGGDERKDAGGGS